MFCFSLAEFVPRAKFTEAELMEIEATYNIEDRTWLKISKNRCVCNGKVSAESG